MLVAVLSLAAPDPFLTFGDEPKSRGCERSQELMALAIYGHRWRTCWQWGLAAAGESFPFLNEFIKEAQMHHHENYKKTGVCVGI